MQRSCRVARGRPASLTSYPLPERVASAARKVRFEAESASAWHGGAGGASRSLTSRSHPRCFASAAWKIRSRSRTVSAMHTPDESDQDAACSQLRGGQLHSLRERVCEKANLKVKWIDHHNSYG